MEHPINKLQVEALYKAINDNYDFVKQHGCEVVNARDFIQIIIGKAAGLNLAEIVKLQSNIWNQ